MKRIPEEYRKYFYLGLSAVIAVWVFCLSFVAVYNIRKDKAPTETTSAVATATVSDEMSSTEAPTIETEAQPSEQPAEPAATVTIDGNNATTSGEYSNPSWVDESLSIKESYSIMLSESEAASEAKEATRVAVPKSKADIVNAYVTAVNKLKETDDFTMKKGSELNMTIDSVTGGEYVKNIVQKYIDEGSHEPVTYTFTNGNDSASGTSPNAELPPDGAIASLDPADVKSAAVKENGNGVFTVTIELGKDNQTLDKKPPVYSSCIDTLDINSIGLTSAMKVESMNISYSGGKIVATIDAGGKLVSMTHSLNIEKGAGTGKITLISVALEMHGTYKQTYNFSYN